VSIILKIENVRGGVLHLRIDMRILRGMSPCTSVTPLNNSREYF